MNRNTVLNNHEVKRPSVPSFIINKDNIKLIKKREYEICSNYNQPFLVKKIDFTVAMLIHVSATYIKPEACGNLCTV